MSTPILFSPNLSGRRLPIQEAVPLPQEQGGNFDPFKAAAARLFVEMDSRLAFQIADNHPGQRLTHNQSDRLVMMALE